jgi:hypothetical protein
VLDARERVDVRTRGVKVDAVTRVGIALTRVLSSSSFRSVTRSVIGVSAALRHRVPGLISRDVKRLRLPSKGRARLVDVAGNGDDRRQYLEFIQTVIGRMSTVSTLAKGWCLTVATATLGFAITRQSVGVGLLGALGVLLFGLLDARYLREERKFRALYDDARKGCSDAYDMNTRPYGQRRDSSFSSSCAWRSVLTSWSLWGFYGPLLLVAAVVVGGAWINR